MDWLDVSTPAFGDYTGPGRCPDCDVPVGAVHMESCPREGIYRANEDDDED